MLPASDSRGWSAGEPLEAATPGLDHNLGLGARQEPFEAQALVAELAIED